MLSESMIERSVLTLKTDCLFRSAFATLSGLLPARDLIALDSNAWTFEAYALRRFAML
jgi:hypothetical protein